MEIELDPTVGQFVDDRELTAPRRRGHDLLGAESWAAFRAANHAVLEACFGPVLRYRRSAHVAVARKP